MFRRAAAGGPGHAHGRSVPRRRLRLLSLGTTFAVAFAAVTATVTVLVGILSYNAAARLVRVDQLSVFHEVVQDVRAEVRENRMAPVDFSSAAPGHDLVRPARTDVQVLGPDGSVYDPGDPGLPVVDADRRIAGAATAGQVVEHADVDVGDDVYRVATVALGGGRGAVQIAQEFSNTEDLLRALQRRTLILMAAVVVGAGLFGWWLARRITRRLVVLTNAAEDVARTRRLGIQVPVAGYDEVGRLGRAFDRMLGRLAQSEEDQRRLVQDAGHELRTPLTSLRTNISLLRRIDELPPGTREELVADLTQEARELTDLVNELVDLAAGQSDTEPPQRVDLAEIAEDVAGLARRRTGREIVVSACGDTTTDGRPGMLTRALSNLVENAVKFDRDSRAPVEIRVAGPARPGTVRVEVRDRGPGIADDDLTRVFDRFYRAADARSLPGSGLGLSIVREVALAHGGAPYAFRRDGGGTVTGFTVGGAAAGAGTDSPAEG
ncbi:MULTISPECIES: HAMP domain-containing sensor histidine kinase [Streptomyces]|uniref:histidine kinase n=2 Tax=Streptomyces TaxID=1883 RepID=A0A514JSG6_9ACTN|nr:HAMP domain-containing sensor histidine kinase [Streptomyces calvus]MYS25930.1 HAMP domain-containing protein [Streptomyces sp. SID7804]MBA8947598.1 two-component system sensor histidine kinase MprB [Streptomyces calvus]MBA8973968.1 two-component system sensor histidine kinase MprB [Streptomyces calvus]QDI70293.1 two-component sensor histidine kinase [Streptomyces calvus]GGP79650.1 two-component sensor histidine kinase [Streptomyces calvus]